MLLRIKTNQGELCFAAVCDGIGGFERGEIASGYVVERLTSLIYDTLIDDLTRGRWKRAKNAVLRCLYDCCRKLKAYGDEKGLQLGTTLCFVCALGGKCLLFHQGDSRIYLLKKKQVKSIFPDDLKEGKLCACIGSPKPSLPSCRLKRLSYGQGLLLATDGFYRGLSEELLREVLRDGGAYGKTGLGKRLETLAGEALKRGSKDHMSAVCLLNR